VGGFGWSRSGRALALTVDDNRISPWDGPFVAVLTVATGSVRFLLTHGGSYEPAWSPNGRASPTSARARCARLVLTAGKDASSRPSTVPRNQHGRRTAARSSSRVRSTATT